MLTRCNGDIRVTSHSMRLVNHHGVLAKVRCHVHINLRLRNNDESGLGLYILSQQERFPSAFLLPSVLICSAERSLYISSCSKPPQPSILLRVPPTSLKPSNAQESSRHLTRQSVLVGTFCPVVVLLKWKTTRSDATLPASCRSGDKSRYAHFEVIPFPA